MIFVARHPENPVMRPNPRNSWEAWAVTNGCPLKNDGMTHLLYRAISTPHFHMGVGEWMRMSEVGYASSRDGVHFSGRRPLVRPEEHWEEFGCEDPRATHLEGMNYIFYTALSSYPFRAEGIKVGVALTPDFETVQEKHLVTTFNAKAMSLFPEKIKGKMWAVLTAHTDIPPAYIALAAFDSPEEMWSPAYWEKWHASLPEHALALQRQPQDHVESGAPPLKTARGWLLIYCYITNYASNDRIFGVEAVLLDLEDPAKIIGRTDLPLLTPTEQYEVEGTVHDVIFPSGALVEGDTLNIYYGAADTTTCIASCNLDRLLVSMLTPPESCATFERFEGNPILEPNPDHAWEAKATFNPAAIYEDGAVHILYRAMSHDNTSVLGYASSRDGYNIIRRDPEPVYVPRESFEMKLKAGGHSGCEDPRLVRMGDKIYMFYTAVDGAHPPRVAITSIDIADFLNQRWKWQTPRLISPPGVDDKNTCLHPEKVNGKYLIYHRLGNDIDLAYTTNLDFVKPRWLDEQRWLLPRRGQWDSFKLGIAAPPLKTEKGWLLLYHGVDGGMTYRVGAVLLDLVNPAHILGRTAKPLFEPETEYEKVGVVPNVVFPCGAVVIDGRVLLYYGGADLVTGVASLELDKILPLEC